MIKAEIIKDSRAPSGVRLTTFVLEYPRFIHSEFMTHRMISKNASSSRAIPTEKMIGAILQDTAMPIAFSKNQKGMQASSNVDETQQREAEQIWTIARDLAILQVEKLLALGIHKQHVNRLLEPFQHIKVVATATDWDNFFALRCHKDAQPEFKALADKMFYEYNLYDQCEEVDDLVENEWHLPFISAKDIQRLYMTATDKELAHQTLIKMSVARCARVSYNNVDGSGSSLEADLQLYDRLTKNTPMHASPTEHQAKAIIDPNARSGNLRGWIQFRKTLVDENITNFKNLLLNKPQIE